MTRVFLQCVEYILFYFVKIITYNYILASGRPRFQFLKSPNCARSWISYQQHGNNHGLAMRQTLSQHLAPAAESVYISWLIQCFRKM